jgi:hypothetical protein
MDWEKEYMEPTMLGVNAFRSYVMAWYDGSLQKIFFAKERNREVINQICSVLAGYVWDQENPFVKNHDTNLKRMVRLIAVGEKLKAIEESESSVQ